MAGALIPLMVDHRLFDHNRIDHRIRLGAVEEWTVVNLDEADHPFHIHTNPSLVTRINAVALAEPVWRDTVNVRGHGSVTLRSRSRTSRAASCCIATS